ncbi:MAG TPA: hypothetical protein VHO48_13690 [Anaerolineaceae bacterium]|nr:hypothetical protein [Anaerolineaceae bacterium]
MLSTLLLLFPILILGLAAGVLTFAYFLAPKFRFSWLVAAAAALFSLIGILFVRSRIPISLQFSGWLPLGNLQASPSLLLDEISWPFAAALVALVFAVIFTATARHQHQTNPFAWAGSLALTALGLIAVEAGNPLTLMLAWTTIDVVELVMLLVHLPDRSMSTRPVVGFAARLAGTLIVFWASISSAASGGNAFTGAALSSASLFFVLGIGLRLGIFPLHLTFPKEPPMRRGLGNVLRLAPVASSLVLLGRLPSDQLDTPWLPVMLGFCALGAFYGALLWTTSSDELNGRPFWIISMASLVVASAIRGQPADGMAWGLGLLLAGGASFLYSARSKGLVFLPALGVWCISGLPFSPTAGAWTGLTSGPIPVLNIIFVLSHALIVYGYLRHAFQEGEALSSMERWVVLTYPLGILILIATMGLVSFANIRSLQIEPFGWVGIISTALGVAWFVWRRRSAALPDEGGEPVEQETWIGVTVKHVYRVFRMVFRLDWLYQLLWAGYRGVGNVVGSLTNILEGDGGVLWVFVLLALFMTLIRAGGVW